MIRNNRISTDPALYGQYDGSGSIPAIYARQAAGGMIKDNYIGSAGGVKPQGIQINCMHCLVENNFIHAKSLWFYQTEGYGIKTWGAEYPQIINNRISSFRTAIDMTNSSGSEYGDNIVSFSSSTPYVGGVDIGNNR